jgi:hypothetical protein
MLPYCWDRPIMTPAARYFKLKASGLKLHLEFYEGELFQISQEANFPRKLS